MDVVSARFGRLSLQEGDVITFADGLIGMESCHRWALLADAQNKVLGWMQSLDRPDLALAVVSPRRFVPGYRVRVRARDLEPLQLASPKSAQVLVIVTKAQDTLALNLKAPIVVNLPERLGRQIVAKDEHAVQYLLGTSLPLRKIA